MAMLPGGSEKNDIVTILYGARCPFALRPHPKNESEYYLVGPAYVHGFMDREAMTWLEEGRLKKQVFILV